MNTIETIKFRLNEISKEESIQILYACESGSRAWGFASLDSDFDIRFIFKRQLNGYMVIKDLPDILEYQIQDNLDFNGWDLKKFLLHLYKSNGVMFEWLQSPIEYWNNKGFKETFQKLMTGYFNPRSTINHYLGLTKRTFLDFGENKEVKLKKYFYILRPLMAARWIYTHKSIPPMEFASLLEAMDYDRPIQTMVSGLKQKKEMANESQLIPRLWDLEAFINSEIQYLESKLPDNNSDGNNISALNDIFLRMVVEN
jgi:uncharacterized protein